MIRLIETLRLRMRSLFRGARVEDELDAEMLFHFHRQREENLAAGMSPEEAKNAARRAIGNRTAIQEQCRDARGVNLIESVFKDIGLAMRTLRKDATFTLVSAVTLAFGIGATTAIFTVVNAVILRPLPYADPDRLVTAWEGTSAGAAFPMNCARFSPGNYLDLRDQSQSFAQIGGFAEQNYNLTGAGDPDRVVAGLATASLFPMLGVHPALGRAFLPSDDTPTAERVAILSQALWAQRFGSNPNVLGMSIRLDDRAHTVIGVMPPGFEVEGIDPDVWLPIERKIAPDDMRWRFSYYVAVIGRLKSGVGLEQARQDVDRILQGIRRSYPDDIGKAGVVAPLLDVSVDSVRRPLLVLLGAVGFVLLIACANVANLNLAHTSARRREIAVRLALGASRGRVVRQLFTESFLLALMGALLGLAVAAGGVNGLLKLAPGEIPRAAEIHLDGWMLMFAILAASAACIGFGLAPALLGSSGDVQDGLREGGRSESSGPAARRARGVLVVSEVALALVLMIGAGLMIESFRRVSSVDPGFKSHGILTMRVPLSQTKYSKTEQQGGFFHGLSTRVRAIPGIQSLGLVDGLPFAPGGFNNNFSIDSLPEPPPGQGWNLNVRRIDPGYFSTLAIPLIAGRTFDDNDRVNTPDVAIVSQSLALKYWPDRNPFGASLKMWFGNPQVPARIVGIAADVRNRLDAAPLEIAYLPYPQGRQVRDMYLVARTEADPASVVKAVRAVSASLDPDQPVYRIRTMDEIMSASLQTRRFEMSLLGAFAALAALLGAVGLYGVLSFTVQARTRELGVRSALGASARQIFGLVLRDAIRLVATGVAVGLVGAFALTRVLTKLLYEVKPSDPATFSAVSLLLLVVALAAAFFPAQRAARVDPMIALRHE